jgi:hypothetical protein
MHATPTPPTLSSANIALECTMTSRRVPHEFLALRFHRAYRQMENLRRTKVDGHDARIYQYVYQHLIYLHLTN